MIVATKNHIIYEFTDKAASKQTELHFVNFIFQREVLIGRKQNRIVNSHAKCRFKGLLQKNLDYPLPNSLPITLVRIRFGYKSHLMLDQNGISPVLLASQQHPFKTHFFQFQNGSRSPPALLSMFNNFQALRFALEQISFKVFSREFQRATYCQKGRNPCYKSGCELTRF